MKKWVGLSVGLSFASAVFCTVSAGAQARGNWTSPRNDMEHSGWQKAETIMSKDNLSEKFKFLWKIKLGDAAVGDSASYSEPILIPSLINAHGFKDFALWAGPNDLYAVDSELGTILWTKHYEGAPSPCGSANLAIVAEAPLIINFRARRAPGTPPPPPQPLLKASERRIGIAPGGGGFGLKGIYVLTGDGYLHEQAISTGIDFAPPVKFLPGPAGISTGLSMNGKTVLSATKAGCAGVENAVWSMDMTSAEYPVLSYKTGAIAPMIAMGPTISDGVAYVVTGSGASSATDVHADSIVALDKDAKAKDWYTPEGGGGLQNATPVAFTYKDKKLLAAPGKDGSYVLLNAESLGGADHHAALGATPSISKAKTEAVAALASWQDANGAWVLASVPGPVSDGVKFENSNGAAPHGSIVAFKVEETGGKTTLAPAWVSRDLVNPAPPVVANGMVIALSQGDASTHAILYVLDAATGKELYSSGDAVNTYAHMAGVAVGDGHAFFVTHDNTMYSFGVGMEH